MFVPVTQTISLIIVWLRVRDGRVEFSPPSLLTYMRGDIEEIWHWLETLCGMRGEQLEMIEH